MQKLGRQKKNIMVFSEVENKGTAIVHSYFQLFAAGMPSFMLAFQDASVLIITDLYLSESTISYNSSVNT